MNKKYTLISISILTALYSQQSLADLHAQCLLGVPHFSGEVVKGDVNNLPVYIEADKAEINQPTQAIYQGNVDLKQGNRHLVGNSAYSSLMCWRISEASTAHALSSGKQEVNVAFFIKR